MKTPDVTQAQILGLVTWVIGQVVALGWVDNNRGQVLLQVATTVLPAIWVIADAIIRHGRSRALQNAPKPVEATTVADDTVSA